MINNPGPDSEDQQSDENPEQRRSQYESPVGILETAIYCEDLCVAGEFYERIVGLTLHSHEPDRHRFYRLRDGMLLVFQPSTTQNATVHIGDACVPKHGALGEGHIAFAVEASQLQPIRDRLAEFDIPIESEITWPTGGHSIYCRDPSNNSVEFATRSLWFKET